MNVAEVMEDVEKDSFYFMNSDGGMTLSGGETCLQPEFARALIEAAHRRYIPVALETAGAVRWESLWKVAESAQQPGYFWQDSCSRLQITRIATVLCQCWYWYLDCLQFSS